MDKLIYQGTFTGKIPVEEEYSDEKVLDNVPLRKIRILDRIDKANYMAVDVDGTMLKVPVTSLLLKGITFLKD